MKSSAAWNWWPAPGFFLFKKTHFQHVEFKYDSIVLSAGDKKLITIIIIISRPVGEKPPVKERKHLHSQDAGS